MLGNIEALDPAVADARPVPGIADAVDGCGRCSRAAPSWPAAGHRDLQDPLTMRIVPQTHSAARIALAHCRVDSRGGAGLVARQPVHQPRRPRALERQLRLRPLRRHPRLPAHRPRSRITASCERVEQARPLRLQRPADRPARRRREQRRRPRHRRLRREAATAEARLLAQPTTLEVLDDEHGRGHRGPRDPHHAGRPAPRPR